MYTQVHHHYCWCLSCLVISSHRVVFIVSFDFQVLRETLLLSKGVFNHSSNMIIKRISHLSPTYPMLFFSPFPHVYSLLLMDWGGQQQQQGRKGCGLMTMWMLEMMLTIDVTFFWSESVTSHFQKTRSIRGHSKFISFVSFFKRGRWE